ncbi:M23 family metallopeptidase [Williamsia sp.]|uniref:M23 family metallopeptidase n=1 Tax=Williamsia sp. TaxID=1872085 RepID=UPI002F936104
MPPDAVVLDLPFGGRWMARNSPARRVPSHGTDLFGSTYAIDFVAVGDNDLPAPRSWRSALSVEAPEIFRGFGEPIVAPAEVTVALVHDGEPDHSARRSQITLLPYTLGQARRVRDGIPAIAGNHVVLALGRGGPFILLAHLRCGTVMVDEGDRLVAGDRVGECGNSGNSTQPHVHVQATDSLNWTTTRGLPVAFRRDRGIDGETWLPGESEVFDAGTL